MATGAGVGAAAATVNRNRPSRRHQPGKTAPSTDRTRNAAQAPGRPSATVTSTLRVSRRRPVRNTLSALSLADHSRFAARSRSAAAST